MLDVTHILASQPLSGLIAFFAVVGLTPVVIRLARSMGWVAHPQEDRWHVSATALMGGIAIFLGGSLSVFLTTPSSSVGLIWLGATLMFVTGLVDDIWEIRPAAKLATQVMATSLLLYAGYSFGHDWALWVSLPLTLIWVVGITNAINLLDNMDGLSAGVAGIAAGVMVVYAAMADSTLAVAVGTPVVGAAFGFLVYNFKPARIFMGDCGSLFLGYIVAALGLIIQTESVSAGPVAVSLVPLAVLAVPIFDTTLVTFVRKLSGRPISQGGRDHSSHRLVFLGLSERHAVLMLYGLSLLSGVAALTALYVGDRLFFALTGIVGVVLVVLGIQLARAEVYEDVSGDGAPRTGFRPLRALHNLMGHHWKALFGILADAVLVGATFVIAHSLRFDSGVPAPHAEQMIQILPFVVSLKIALFYAFGLYRGIWRYAGTPELVRTGLATLTASGAT
ncbi:glycosyltransferase family 4 protein, partial [Longibacter sp.]|uniref:glycosyltransferase family 4 protein n=1 Tax=Longibacter sp. TaxID=2045415 RepID=UPI003EB8E6C3